MAELEIDQSNLPRVQEVRQCFAVLEDGVLAHNLQEQEIEQYYTANVQKSQLVQSDIRMARRLQDEERDQLQHVSRQREEQDSEYARLIQEELQRGAEEAHRREREDQEIAKQIQKEEELCARRRVDCHTNMSRDASGLPDRRHSTRAWARTAEGAPRRPRCHSARGRRPPSSPSPFSSPSQSPSPPLSPPSPPPSDCERRPEWYPDDHDNDDSRPPRRRSRPAPLVGPAESEASVPASGAPFSGGWADALRLIKQDMSDQGYVPCADENEPHTSPLHRLERVVLSEQRRDAAAVAASERHHRHPAQEGSSCRGGDRSSLGGWEGGENGRRERWGRGDEREWRSETRAARHSVSEIGSVVGDGRSSRALERVGSWASRDSGDRRVHFQDDRGRCIGYRGDSRWPYEGGRDGLRERGDVLSYCGDSRLTSNRSRGSQSSSAEDDYWQQRAPPLQRNALARRSYHGGDSARLNRRQSFQNGHSYNQRRQSFQNGRSYDHRRQSFQNGGSRDNQQNGGFVEDRPRRHGASFSRSHSRCIPEENGRGELLEAPSLRERAAWERRSCRGYGPHGGHPDSHGYRRSEQQPREEPGAQRWHGEHRASGRRHCRRGRGGEDGFSSGEEQEQEEEEGFWERRADSHTAPSHRPSHTGVPARGKAAPLAMGELQQVLLDEELARRLQEEEGGLHARSPKAASPPRRLCVDGDFRVAQVAQDEEIARFMQKQELRSGHSWREADASGSSPDAGEPCVTPGDWRPARQRPQRERLDSQGLPSPPEDYPADDPPSSPVGVALQQQQPLRNIAEDLDPTFQRNVNIRPGQTDPASQDHPPQAQQSGYGAREEPNFVQPTKRPNEKLGAAKAKEKKENSKQRENCKQQ